MKYKFLSSIYLLSLILVFSIFLPINSLEAKTADAIGIRVMTNPERLSPATWYFRNVPKPGNPQALIVNGYPAIKEGRTVYVAGLNVSNGRLYSNIYIFSYSENATESTKIIYDQLLKNLKFNVNIEDPQDLAKLRRDMKRIGDLNDIRLALERYKNIHGKYPTLEEGTYVRGITFSTWPSWQATLGNKLGLALPVDPLNKFIGCEKKGADKNTCWNEIQAKMICPDIAYVYAYRVEKNGDKIELFTNFEYNQGIHWKTGDFKLFSKDDCFSFAIQKEVDFDGDGITNIEDLCPYVYNTISQNIDSDKDGIGDLCDACPDDPYNDIDKDGVCAGLKFKLDKLGANDNCPFKFNPNQTDRDYNSRTKDYTGDGIGDACDLKVCGNGRKEGDEECDDQDGLIEHTVCNRDCTLKYLTYCGNGIVDTNNNGLNDYGEKEECDKKGGGGSSSMDQYACTKDCKWTGGWCGNKKVDKEYELCDPTASAEENQIEHGKCALDCQNIICDTKYVLWEGKCVEDKDEDGVPDFKDNCPKIANPNQLNSDNDKYGDVCDYCPDDPNNDKDKDGICVGKRFNPEFKKGANDNCPTVFNPDQIDNDYDPKTGDNTGDGIGDACDPQVCGNNKIEKGEVCDGPGQGTSPDKQYQCSKDCQKNFGGWCGDNSVNGPEQCDNKAGKGTSVNDQYECSADCTWQGGYCGDGIIQESYGELCEADGKGTAVNDQYKCVNCTWQGGYCGDGIVQKEYGEDCEADGRGTSVSDQYKCVNCKWQGGYCGNGVTERNFGEECDGASGGYDSNLYRCNNNCKIERKPIVCGNGIVEPGEACDNGSSNGVGCTPGSRAYYDDYCSYCSADCKRKITRKRLYIVRSFNTVNGYSGIAGADGGIRCDAYNKGSGGRYVQPGTISTHQRAYEYFYIDNVSGCRIVNSFCSDYYDRKGGSGGRCFTLSDIIRIFPNLATNRREARILCENGTFLGCCKDICDNARVFQWEPLNEYEEY